MEKDIGALLIDPNMPRFKETLAALRPTPGFCIFVDIAGSTEMKDGDIRSWIAYLLNTFNNIQLFLRRFPPVKAIGDELLFFIPDSHMPKTGETALRIFNGLASIVREPNKRLFKDTKAAIAYCRDSYAITFIPRNLDYYGKDIDLTSRLLTKANAGEVVLNHPFYEKLMDDYNAIGNKEQFPEVEEIVGPWPERFKGFKKYLPIYKLPTEMSK